MISIKNIHYALAALLLLVIAPSVLAQDKVEVNKTREWDNVKLKWVNKITYTACNSYTYTYTSAIGKEKKVFTEPSESIGYMYNGENYIVTCIIYKTGTKEETVNVCDSYTWNYGTGLSETYNTLGTHTYTKTLEGAVNDFCDSIKTLNLTIRKSSQTAFNPGPQCEEYYWPANNRTYTESTTDNVHFKNQAGCDSLVTLTLVVNKNSSADIYETKCDSYKWHGTTYRATEDISRHDNNAVNCDSTTTLHLTIHKSNTSTITEDVCDSYTWMPYNRTYTESTTDNITMTNIYGCDSSITLNLTVRHSSASTISESIIQNQLPYTFNGHTYSTLAGAFEIVTITNTQNCDSSITYTLTVYPNVTATADTTVCENILKSQSGFRWNGRAFTSVGSQTIVLTAHTGADSTLTMNVAMYPSYNPQEYKQICDNQSYSFYGTNCKQQKAYNKKFTTVNGCDSIITLNLTVRPTYKHTVSKTICKNNPISFCNTTYDTPGSYTCYDLRSVYDCDSIVTLKLTVNDTSTSEVFDTIVQNKLPKTYYNLIFTKNDVDGTGDSSRIARYANGNSKKCDSVITYHLKVWKNVYDTLDSVICASDINTFTWNGKMFNRAATQSVTLPTSNMADSVVVMQVSTESNPVRTITDTIVENLLPVTIYQGTEYEKSFNDEVKNYKFNIHMPGCDSLITYNLYVKRNSTTVIDTAVCADLLAEGVVWRGKTFTAVGRQFETLTASDGTDSILAYVMNEHPLYNNAISRTICSNKNTTFGGKTYNTAGTYVDSALSVYGCDSVTTLTLKVNPVTYGEQYDTVVENRLNDRHTVGWYDYRYGWYYQGTYYRSPQEHTTVTIRNVKQCDSVIDYNLFVYWNQDTTLFDTICGDLLPYTWDGGEYQVLFAANVYGGNPKQGTKQLSYKRLTTHGADSIIYLSLTVHPSYHIREDSTDCEQNLTSPYPWHDTVLPAGTVTGQFQLARKTIYGCDSVHTLYLTINSSSESWVYDTIVENQVLAEGCYKYHSLQFCTTDTIRNQQVVIQNARGCDSTVHYHLLVHKNVTGEDSTTICGDQIPWSWNNATFVNDSLPAETIVGKSPSGTIVMKGTILANNGADSVVTMTVHVNPVYSFNLYDTICDDTSAFFMGNEYTETGTDVLHLISSLQCDSAWTYQLTVFPTYEEEYYDTIYQDEYAYFCGWAYNKAGTYTDTLRTEMNCDSIQTLNLVVNWRIRVDSSICNNYLPFVWNRRIFNNASIDSSHLRSSEGLDSLVIMTLYVRDTTFSYDPQEHCDSFAWRNGIVYKAENFTDTVKLTNAVNCDSVIHLTLIMHYATPDTHQHHACNTFTWLNSITYDSSIFGPQYMLRTTYGCDSLVTLDLTVDYDTYDEELDSICEGDILNWRGRALTKGDTYYDSLLTARGCDSITALFLTEMPSFGIEFDLNTDCFVKEHHLSLSAPVDYVKWSVYPDDGSLRGQEYSRTITVSPKQNVTYSLYADYRKEPLCPVTKTITLRKIVQPHAVLRTAPEYFTYDDITLEALDRSEADYDRNWFINDYNVGEHDATMHYDINPGDDTIKVMLEVMTDYCRDSVYAYIPVLKPVLFLPNVFTPGQQSNNRFRAMGDEITDFEMYIYNRRGQLIFHSTDINDSWDGTFEGTECPQGAYVYRIRYRSTIIQEAWKSLSGTVTLLR